MIAATPWPGCAPDESCSGYNRALLVFSFDSWAAIWITVALVAAVVEVSIPHFGIIFVSAGAFAAAAAAYLSFGLPVQIVLFIIVVAVSFLVLRPMVLKNMGAAGVPGRTEVLIGREGIVTHDIETHGRRRPRERRRPGLGGPRRRADCRRHAHQGRRRRRHRSGGQAGMTTYVLFAIALFLLVILMKAVKIVPQKQVKIIERLGKYHRTAEAGLNTIFPFLDSVRETIDQREQITKIEPQAAITRDNVTMEVDAVIYYVIMDPVRAVYEVQNLKWGIEQLTLSALRNVIGALDLDHTLTSRDTINGQLRTALDTATQQWGIKVMRIELKNITPPEEIRLTMEKQMTAERSRRAVVTTAEGEKASAILRAEGQKQSQIVNAEGSKQAAILAAEGQAEARLRVAQAEAQAIEMVTRSLGPGPSSAQYLIAKSYLESLGQIAKDADKLVFLPYEAAGVMASLGGLKELLKTPAGEVTVAQFANVEQSECRTKHVARRHGERRTGACGIRPPSLSCSLFSPAAGLPAAGDRSPTPNRIALDARDRAGAHDPEPALRAVVRHSGRPDGADRRPRHDSLRRHRHGASARASTSPPVPTRVRSVAVGGKPSAFRVVNGHIVIPASALTPARTPSRSRFAPATRRSTATPTSSTRSSCRRGRTRPSPASINPT